MKSARMIFLLAGLFSLDSLAHSQVRFVDQSAPPPGDGLTWNTAFPDVQTGIDAVTVLGGGDVLVAEGSYSPTATWGGGTARHRAFVLKQDVRLHGGFLGRSVAGSSTNPDAPDGSFADTVLTGATDDSYHVVVANGGGPAMTGVVLDGFKVRKGNANGTNDHARGGGLFARNVEILVENVVFRGNYGRFGGGAFLDGHNSKLYIKQSTFRNNDGTLGAGAYVDAQSPDVKAFNVNFARNGSAATQRGGGLFIGIEVNIEAANCRFFDNAANIAGAGVYADPDDFGNGDLHTWRHCTIAGNHLNSAALAGAGMHYAFGDASETVLLENSIVWGNTNGFDLYVTSPVQFIYSSSDVGTLVGGAMSGGGNLSVDPLFVNLAGGNLRLRDPLYYPGAFSPCIDAGDITLLGSDSLDLDGDPATTILPWDLDDGPRVIDFASVPGLVDMGAYEAPSVSIPR